jgi:hypothetical protein
LSHVKQDHPNRQTEKGLGKEKGTPWKEERYWDSKTKRLPYTKKRKLVLNDEEEESIDRRNNIRYLRMN